MFNWIVSFSLRNRLMVLAFAAHHLQASVKWTSSRSEEFTSATQGRGARLEGELWLDAQGRFAELPTRVAGDAPCSPDVPAHCNLNRQDWVALLKLYPEARDTAAMTLARVP